jgi:hypothetical protein
MLNLILNIVSFPIKLLKKVPNGSLGGFVPVRFALAVVFAFAAGACFITANQGYARTPLSILGWILVAAIVDVFWYANSENKA